MIEDFDEVLERNIKKCGNARHVQIPERHQGKQAIIVIGGKKKG